MSEPSPYAPPSSVVRDRDVLPLANEPQSVQRSLYGAFAQHDSYLAKWRDRLEGRSQWAGFNWPAALFGIVWCFYRKLYWLGIAALVAGFVVSVLAGVVIGIFAPDLLGSDAALNLAGLLVLAVFVRLPLGLIANRVYFRRASKAIAECVGRRPDGPSALGCVHQRGGTSTAGLVVALVISFLVRLMLGAV